MIPFGELAPDVADLNTGVANVANNVIPGINSYNPMPSLEPSSNALTNPCKGAVTMKDEDSVNYIYAGDKLALYNITGVTVTDYSKVGGYSDNTERWEFVKWENQVIASKLGDTPQVLTLGGTTFADLAGTPPQGKTVTVIRDFVALGNTFDGVNGNKPIRVQWSGFNDETQWTVGTNQSGFQDLEGSGGAIKKIVGGEYGTIFQELAIWRMTYVGTPSIFQFDEIESGKGAVTGGAVVKHGANIYYLSNDGFYVLMNGTTSNPIGVNKIDKWFWNDVNQSYLENITGALAPSQGFILWSYPSMDSSDGTPDKVIAYNYKTDRWATGDVGAQVVFTGADSGYTLEDLDAFGTVDTLTASMDSAVWKGGAFKISAFNTDNKLSFFSGTPLSGTVETGEISTDNRMTQLSSVRPAIDGTCTVRVATRNILTETPSNTPEISTDTTGKANFRTNKRYHRIRVTTSGEFTNAIGVEADVKQRGKR